MSTSRSRTGSRQIQRGVLGTLGERAALLGHVALDVGEDGLEFGFVADGGDNFNTFRQVDPASRIGGGIDLDELVRYMAQGPVSPPGTNRVNEQLP